VILVVVVAMHAEVQLQPVDAVDHLVALDVHPVEEVGQKIHAMQ